MKIGINARFLHSEILEGLGRYTWETTKRMVLYHPNDTFYFFFDRPYLSKYIIASNIIPVVVRPAARHPFLFYYWFEFVLPRSIGELGLDVFYSADNFLSLKLKIPTVLVLHDLAYNHYPKHIPFIARSYYKHYIPKFIKHANEIICVSQYVKDDIVSTYQVNPFKITVAYNALPNRIRSNTAKFDIDKRYFVYVGSLNPRKNIGNMLLAFKSLLTEGFDLKFVLVGKIFNLDTETITLISELKTTGRVLHLTNVSDQELPSIIEGAIAMTYVSLFEGFGIPILEAMDLGVPVITSNVSSMPEVASAAAILIDPTSISEIAKAMADLATDKQLVAKLRTKGYKRVKNFSWDKTSAIIWQKLLDTQ